MKLNIQEHGMQILFPFHNTGFDSLQEYEKNESEKAGEEILCEILYIENSDKVRFSDLKNRVENDYVLNKAYYPRTVTTVQSLLLKYQHNYNSNKNSQSNRIRNQIKFVQRRRTGGDRGGRKEKDKRPRRNMNHITCNNFGDKGHYAGNSECLIKNIY